MTNENDVERLKTEALDEFMKGRSSKDLRQIAFEIISETFNWLRMKDHLTAQTWRGRIDVDMVAQFIRTIDGDNKMGAAELAEKICDHLTASGRLAGWRPIESAPREYGVPVLLAVGFPNQRRVAVGERNKNELGDYWWIYSELGGEKALRTYIGLPTHWQPLPPAPSARKEG